MLDVHDDVAQAEEVLRVQRLSEEICVVVLSKERVRPYLSVGVGVRLCVGEPL